MKSVIAKAEKLRERADQVRTIAVDVRCDDDSKILMDVAKDYERMAREAEIASSKGKCKKVAPRTSSHA